MSRRRFPLAFWIILLIGMIILSGCGSSAASSNQPIVTTSISPLADIIQQVGGDKIKVIHLVPVGGDPHEFEPRPEDVRNLAESNLFFANGVGEELYLEKLIANTGNQELRTVVLSDGLPIIGRDQSSVGNPHLWLDVENTMAYVNKIQAALSAEFPQYQSYFEQNAARYLQELKNLDAWIQSQISSIPPSERKIVVFHDAWAYYAKRYNLTLVEPLLHSGEAEPSAQDLAQMLQLIKEQKIRAIFSEAGFNPKQVKQLAVDAGIKLTENLYDDTLGATPETDTYLGMMRANTIKIVEALR
ncbi:metal ABC transporter substrate-binding protein [Paradesulfitobacterium ferrireducens]|uniref:metal ABC transporter substrate-binding protein n=1 Tax=Paradesulfitobacterium ferrireducens TaxID=2816476 RepID=UPI001F37065C|nr:metal ABC transporter substrate-binding protein [Paradesulfitobacterium ferrireducens]